MKLQRSILQISHAKTFKIKYTTGAHKIILSKNIHKITKTDYVWFEFLCIRRYVSVECDTINVLAPLCKHSCTYYFFQLQMHGKSLTIRAKVYMGKFSIHSQKKGDSRSGFAFVLYP